MHLVMRPLSDSGHREKEHWPLSTSSKIGSQNSLSQEYTEFQAGGTFRSAMVELLSASPMLGIICIFW